MRDSDSSTSYLSSSATPLQNWMKTTTTIPNQLVEVDSIEQIQAIVKDAEKYPSPIRPAGSILSPTDIHLNDGGTTLLMSKMNKIHGIITHSYSRMSSDGTLKREEVVCLETDPCVTLRDVQLYAHKHGYELPFSAEIGMATVGGTIFDTTKDSAIGKSPIEGSGMGDVCSCAFSFTVVDDLGDLCVYNMFNDDGQFDENFQSMLDSHGTRGIAVKAALTIRKKTPVTIDFYIRDRADDDSAEIANFIHTKWKNANSMEGNVFAVIGQEPGFLWLEERVPTANKPNQQAPLSKLIHPIMQRLKNYMFERCRIIRTLKYLSPLSGSKWFRLKLDSRPAGFLYNKDIPDGERRLSFSYCAFPIISLVEVVTKCLEFVNEYKVKHDFEPHALVIYFVEQSGKRCAGGYHRNETSKDDTHTFAFDPTYHNPNDPAWHKFLDALHAWQISHGGVPSITQTFRLEHQDLSWGAMAVHGTPSQRFTNKFIQQFYDAKLSV